MCGIVGILQRNALIHLFEGIRQLQNRGYDSAGIAYYKEEISAFDVYKYASTDDQIALDKLQKVIGEDDIKDQENILSGIAHTRWATHGGKTDANSHPHTSYDGKFTLVHNGIIENYASLKKKCTCKGASFSSQTDSEVIVNLLSIVYQEQEEDDKNISLAIQEVCRQMEGTWALVIMCSDKPNELFCTRHGSPLLIGKQEDCAYIVSEQSAFNNQVQDYFILNNHDICHLYYEPGSTDSIRCDTQQIYQTKTLEFQQPSFGPAPYSHFMEKEIMEQVDSSLRAISLGGRVLSNDCVKLGGLEIHETQIMAIDHLILLGCGTSYNAGLLGMEYFKELSNFTSVQLFDGADFDMKDVPRNGITGLVLLSQSGETKDLHRCIQIGRSNNLFLIGVVNVVDSLIAREVDCGVYLNAGREVGVASTKSFTSQVIVLSLMSVWFAQKREVNANKRRQYVSDLRNLHTNMERTLNQCYKKMDSFVDFFRDFPNCFLLGKGRGHAIALEGALKIKEIAYIHAEGYSASSLKHGPLALLKKDFPVILIHTNSCHESKIHNVYRELKSRNANILYISYEETADFLDENDLFISLHCGHNLFADILSILPLQLLSYYNALRCGYNPDMPRNLAKVVTVE